MGEMTFKAWLKSVLYPLIPGALVWILTEGPKALTFLPAKLAWLAPIVATIAGAILHQIPSPSKIPPIE
jgi:hypothetical protein